MALNSGAKVGLDSLENDRWTTGSNRFAVFAASVQCGRTMTQCRKGRKVHNSDARLLIGVDWYVPLPNQGPGGVKVRERRRPDSERSSTMFTSTAKKEN